MRRLTTLTIATSLTVLLVTTLALAGGEPPKKTPKKADAEKAADGSDAPPSFPEAMRDEAWPGEWESAKAYSYNMTKAYGPGASIWVWRGESWNPNIDSTHDLTREQAEAALALVHQGAGALLVSKCAFPRHAVVFFDEAGEPLASVNVCFECGDILVYPAYGDDEMADKKYTLTSDVIDEYGSERPLLDVVHEAVMPRWADFFKELGVALER